MASSNISLDFATSSTTRNFAVKIEDPEFFLVFRKKVNAVAIGPNEKRIRDLSEDVGQENYKDSVPKIPPSMPSEFRELYKT